MFDGTPGEKKRPGEVGINRPGLCVGRDNRKKAEIKPADVEKKDKGGVEKKSKEGQALCVRQRGEGSTGIVDLTNRPERHPGGEKQVTR